jgi:hypothetical protein
MVSVVHGQRREVAVYDCGCRVFILSPDADVKGGMVQYCRLHAAAREMLEFIAKLVADDRSGYGVEARALLARVSHENR